jgi:hypothetical protein
VFALTMRHLGHEATNERKGTLYSTDNDPVKHTFRGNPDP